MPNDTPVDLSDFVTLPELAAEYPATYPLATLKYLSRAAVRRTNDFESCLRRISSRKLLISRSAFAAWIQRQTA